jgi:hypothetical protein
VLNFHAVVSCWLLCSLISWIRFHKYINPSRWALMFRSRIHLLFRALSFFDPWDRKEIRGYVFLVDSSEFTLSARSSSFSRLLKWSWSCSEEKAVNFIAWSQFLTVPFPMMIIPARAMWGVMPSQIFQGWECCWQPKIFILWSCQNV